MSGFGGAVKLTGESEYRKALASINQSLKEVDSELKLVTSQYDKNDKSEQALIAQTEALNKKYDTQKQKVNTLEKQLKELEQEAEKNRKKHNELGETLDKETKKLAEIEKASGKDSEAYKKQAKTVSDLANDYKKSDEAIRQNEKTLSDTRIALNKAQAELNKTAKEIDNLGKESKETASDNKELGKSFETAGNDAKQGTSGVSAFSVAIGNLVSGAITGAINKLKELGQVAKQAFAEFDEVRDSIIFATGATGEEAESLKNSYKKVAQTVTGSMSDIGKAVGEVSTRFGFTEKELEDASTKFIKFSKITGTDVKTAVSEVSRALEKSGMSGAEYTDMLDMLLIASQKTGVATDRLADSVTKYAVPMKSLGFNTKDTIAIFSQFEKSGVNVEQAFNGMQKASAKWAKEGKSASEEFAKLMDEIKNSPSDIEASTKAIEAFGSKSGLELANSIRSGKMEYSDMLDFISNSKGRLESTFEGSIDATDKLRLAWQKLRLKLAEVVERLVNKYAPDIESAIDSFVPQIEDFCENVLPDLVEGVAWFIKNLPTIIPIIEGIVTAMLGLWVAEKIGMLATMFGILTGATEAQTVAQWGLNTAMMANPIGAVIALVAGLVVGIVSLYKHSKKFRDFLNGFGEFIKNGFIGLGNFLAEFFTETVPNFLYDLGEAIVTKGAEILEFIGTLPAKIGDILGAIAYDISQFVFNGIKNSISFGLEFVGNIVKYVSELPAKFAGILTDVLAEVGAFAINIGKKAYQAGKNVFDNIVNTVKSLPSKFANIGREMIEGLWSGIKGAGGWLKDKIGGFCSGVVSKVKGFFKIFSPSHLFRDEIGRMLALGLGEGFVDEMNAVSDEMNKAVPTAFDMPEFSDGDGSLSGIGMNGNISYNDLVNAFREALEGVNVEMDNVNMGRFVKKTVTNAIYT